MEFARMAQFRARQTPLDACDCHMHIYDPRFALAGTWPVMPPVARVAAYREMQRAGADSQRSSSTPNRYGFDNACTEDAVRELGASAAAGRPPSRRRFQKRNSIVFIVGFVAPVATCSRTR